MKEKTIILTIFLLLSLNSFAQIITGVYTRNNNEYLNFLPNNRIEFLFERPGCFGVERLTGKGNYKLKKNKIIIEVKSHRKELESTFSQKIPFKNKSELLNVEFLILDENKKPLPFVSITYKKKNSEVEGAVSDENGLAELSIVKSSDSEIEVSYLGYISAFIPIQDINSKRIIVTLKTGNTIFLDNTKLKMRLKLNNNNRTFEIKEIRIK